MAHSAGTTNRPATSRQAGAVSHLLQPSTTGTEYYSPSSQGQTAAHQDHNLALHSENMEETMTYRALPSVSVKASSQATGARFPPLPGSPSGLPFPPLFRPYDGEVRSASPPRNAAVPGAGEVCTKGRAQLAPSPGPIHPRRTVHQTSKTPACRHCSLASLQSP